MEKDRMLYMKLCFVVIVFGLSFIACYKLPIPKTPFYPDAYKFVNTKEEFLSNMKLINNAIKVEAIIDTNKLDFNNYTYLFVFGAPIKKCTIVLRLHSLTINLRVTQRL